MAAMPFTKIAKNHMDARQTSIKECNYCEWNKCNSATHAVLGQLLQHAYI